MKKKDRVIILEDKHAGFIESIDDGYATIRTPAGIRVENLEVLEIIKAVYEAYKFLKPLFPIKCPISFVTSSRTYNLNIRYDDTEEKIYAYYKAGNKILIGADGKTIREARKKLIKKTKEAGYI